MTKPIWCSCKRKPGDPTGTDEYGGTRCGRVIDGEMCRGLISAPIGHPDVEHSADENEKLRAHWARQAEENVKVRRHARLAAVDSVVRRVLQESEEEVDSLRSWSETRVAQAEQAASKAADRAVVAEARIARALEVLNRTTITGDELFRCLQDVARILKGET